MKKIIVFITVFAIFVAVMAWDASAIRITIKRIVFEGAKRADSITVINSSIVPVTYRVGWRHFQMTEDKALKAIKPGDPLPAGIKPVTDMVRFAPRRFTIPPQSSQEVRIMFRTPKGLEEGEYRSHLWIRPEANIDDLRRLEEKKTKKGGGVALKMLTGVTMPVIVRKGKLSSSLSFENASATDNGSAVNLSFVLLREGERSVYGDLVYTCNKGANEYELGANRGIALYPESNRRRFNVSLDKKPGQSACNSLTLSFGEKEGFGTPILGTIAEQSVYIN